MGLGNAEDKVSELQVPLEDLFEEYVAFVNNTSASLMQNTKNTSTTLSYYHCSAPIVEFKLFLKGNPI